VSLLGDVCRSAYTHGRVPSMRTALRRSLLIWWLHHGGTVDDRVCSVANGALQCTGAAIGEGE
jgi:hypothetical protein